MSKVNKENFKQYKFVDDYRNDTLKKLTDEELQAQKYWIREIYRGKNPYIRITKEIALRSIYFEQLRRKQFPKNKVNK